MGDVAKRRSRLEILFGAWVTALQRPGISTEDRRVARFPRAVRWVLADRYPHLSGDPDLGSSGEIACALDLYEQLVMSNQIPALSPLGNWLWQYTLADQRLRECAQKGLDLRDAQSARHDAVRHLGDILRRAPATFHLDPSTTPAELEHAVELRDRLILQGELEEISVLRCIQWDRLVADAWYALGTGHPRVRAHAIDLQCYLAQTLDGIFSATDMEWFGPGGIEPPSHFGTTDELRDTLGWLADLVVDGWMDLTTTLLSTLIDIPAYAAETQTPVPTPDSRAIRYAHWYRNLILPTVERLRQRINARLLTGEDWLDDVERQQFVTVVAALYYFDIRYDLVSERITGAWLREEVPEGELPLEYRPIPGLRVITAADVREAIAAAYSHLFSERPGPPPVDRSLLPTSAESMPMTAYFDRCRREAQRAMGEPLSPKPERDLQPVTHGLPSPEVPVDGSPRPDQSLAQAIADSERIARFASQLQRVAVPCLLGRVAGGGDVVSYAWAWLEQVDTGSGPGAAGFAGIVSEQKGTYRLLSALPPTLHAVDNPRVSLRLTDDAGDIHPVALGRKGDRWVLARHLERGLVTLPGE